jgi:hypothetical protein
MKFATAAAALSLIGVASLLTPGYSRAQDVPPSVHVPQSQSDQPNTIQSGARRTSAQFIAQPAGSASGAAATATVAQRFAPTAIKQAPSGAANSK